MSTKTKVWRNGKYISWEQATVHVLSHGFSRGSAIFDVFRVYETVDGPAAFRMDEHINRLFYTAKLLGMNISWSKQELKQAALETIKENRITRGLVKILAYWDEEAVLKLVPDAALSVDIFVIDESDNPDIEDKPLAKACISKWRKIPPECSPAKAKACAHYLNGMLVRADARRRGFDVGILLDMNGFVAECSIEALFMVKDNVLITPNLGWILRSITRQTILEVARDESIETDERPITREELMAADECFIACTSDKVRPIGLIDDYVVENSPGPLSIHISKLCKDIVKGNDSRYGKWLTHV